MSIDSAHSGNIGSFQSSQNFNTCPHCGFCENCGRSNRNPFPAPQYPAYFYKTPGLPGQAYITNIDPFSTTIPNPTNPL